MGLEKYFNGKGWVVYLVPIPRLFNRRGVRWSIYDHQRFAYARARLVQAGYVVRVKFKER